MNAVMNDFMEQTRQQVAKQAVKIIKGYAFLLAIKSTEKLLIELPLRSLHKTCELYGLDKEKHIPNIKQERKIYKY